MKILSLTKEIKKDIVHSGTKIKNATSTGYHIASRNAHIYKLGEVHKCYNITRSISDKIIKSTSKKEIPYVAGALGMFIPVPFVSPILMGLGFLISYGNFGTKSKENEKTNCNI